VGSLYWLMTVSLLLNCGLVLSVFAHGDNHDNAPITTPAEALAIAVITDTQGHIWRAKVNNGVLQVDHSEDLAKTFLPPVNVNPTPMNIAAKGESRPTIVVAENGDVFVSWTEALKKNYAGNIWFSRSVDKGKTFQAPFIVHQDKSLVIHRFDVLSLSPNGVITIAWVDGRDAALAKSARKPYNGMAIYYAISKNRGLSFEPEIKLADSGCECCRLAITQKPDNTVAVLWRHVFANGERDHAMIEIQPNNNPGQMARASYDHWKIDGCPDHGPTIASGLHFGYHLAYFDGAGDKPSLKYARMDNQAWVTSPPKRFGDSKNNPGHPKLLSQGENVWLVWREGNTHHASIWGLRSQDGGRQWTIPKKLISTNGLADYPQLIEVKSHIYVLVNTIDEGLKVQKWFDD
jgi:hypothetical protein